MAQEDFTKSKSKTRPISETRKIRKPLMERKRRERINTSLNELARLLVEAQKVQQDGGKATKLEKADILEHTVRHLQSLQENCQPKKGRKGSSESIEDAKIVEEKYQEGFKECIKVVEKALNKYSTNVLRERLLNHLYARFKSLKVPHKCSNNEEVQFKDNENRLNLNEEQNFSVLNSPEEETTNNYSNEKCSFTLIPTELPDGGVAFLLKGDPQKLLKGWGQLNAEIPVKSSRAEESNCNHLVSEFHSEEEKSFTDTYLVESEEQDNNLTTANHFKNDSRHVSAINQDEQPGSSILKSKLPSSMHSSNSKRLKPYSVPKVYFQNSPNQNKSHCPPTPPPSPPTDEAHKQPRQDAAVNENNFCQKSPIVVGLHLVDNGMKMEHDINEPFDLSLTRMWRPW